MPKLLLVANVSKEHIQKFHIPFILKMKSLGWRVDVACRLDELVPEADNAYDLPCDRDPFNGGILKSIRILKDILKQNRYDIVLCNTIVGSVIARMAAAPFRKNGLKVLYLNHGLHFFPGAPISRWLMGYPMEKFLASKTDVMITINSSDYETAKKYLNIPEIERIHGMGVNLNKFTSSVLSVEQRAARRTELGITADDYVLTYVAEINDNKNQIMLLNAFEIIRKSIPNAKLVLIGPEHDEGALRQTIKDKGLQDDVLLLGWRSDVPMLLHLSDIYVASSKSEGLGLNLIEAMACDLPVVASKNRGHAEIINSGINGFLVELGDFEEMAAKVLLLHDDHEVRNAIIEKASSDRKIYDKSSTLIELCELVERYIH